jgi:hypothetical protein
MSVAALLSTLPAALVKTARYSWPLSEVVAPLITSWSEVALLTLVHTVPPSAEVCHWTVGAGDPDAAASNVAVSPSSTVVPTGCWVTWGGVCTLRVAAFVTASPAGFVKRARNS